MWKQVEFTLKPRPRGFHLVTDEVLKNLPDIRNYHIGMLNLFIKHSSASLTINENADPSVRQDMEAFFLQNVPDGMEAICAVYRYRCWDRIYRSFDGNRYGIAGWSSSDSY